MPENAANFIIAFIALAILLTLVFNNNSYASVAGNITSSRVIFTIPDDEQVQGGQAASGEVHVAQAGDFYDYTLRINPSAQVNPKSKEDIIVIPVVRFKNEIAEGDGFPLSAGEELVQPQIEVKVTSPQPPLTEGANGENIFSNGQEYIFRSQDTGVFTVKLTELKKKYSIFHPFEVKCSASFMASCRTLTQFANDLLECTNDVIDKKCSNKLSLCDGSVTIIFKQKNDCKNIAVDVQVEGGKDWIPLEQAYVSFFRKSECTDSIPVKEWATSCNTEKGNDFLGSYAAKLKFV